MQSPFPGMNPYLEEPSLWPDVHLTLIIAMRAALNASMPPGYVGRVDKYYWSHESEQVKWKQPIVAERELDSATTATMISASRKVILPVARHEGNKSLKVIDSRSKQIVTVIQLLSHADKRSGFCRKAYVGRRINYLAAGINVVEIHLLRGGRRLPIDGEVPPHCDYYALVCRARQMPTAGIWPFTVRDPLPTIPIPLLPADGDVPLDLRRCLDRAFEESRYDLKLNYQQPPDPPLSPADAQWAQSLLEKQADS